MKQKAGLCSGDRQKKSLLNDRNNRALHNWLVLIWMRKETMIRIRKNVSGFIVFLSRFITLFSGSEEESNGESKTSME
ncbi:hypothetical protein MOA99_15915 [Bacillus haynesii]|uniref:hypothetical protein n=1 Tax=Bacillus haynesii TaxID=1925021 RepID=UPI00196A0A9B|nr:hypothetical protein [Bacillus haynesii]MCY7850102.1 hypothetical protein [Bacillus haynesii]